ncbi:unnamed protein product [Soboliphyme baturini]|uniref:PH domain-containing protein n=1 Tax=Soboliphyme baturini TaxID=241478 RepID=A0A183IXD0_9BILA|nr:unnamed protein product [Soboliphyme baturini]
MGTECNDASELLVTTDCNEPERCLRGIGKKTVQLVPIERVPKIASSMRSVSQAMCGPAREIYKAGWVKLTVGKRPVEVGTHQPYKVFDLLQCSYVIGVVANDCAFSIGFEHEDRDALQLVVLSPEEKNSWLERLQCKLLAMHCLQCLSSQPSLEHSDSSSISTKDAGVAKEETALSEKTTKPPLPPRESPSSPNCRMGSIEKTSAGHLQLTTEVDNEVFVSGYDVPSAALNPKHSRNALSVSSTVYENAWDSIVDRLHISPIPTALLSLHGSAEHPGSALGAFGYKEFFDKPPFQASASCSRSASVSTTLTKGLTNDNSGSISEPLNTTIAKTETEATLQNDASSSFTSNEAPVSLTDDSVFDNYDSLVENVSRESYKTVRMDPTKPPPLPPRNFNRKLTPKERDVIDLMNEISEKTSIRILLSPGSLTRVAFVEILGFLCTIFTESMNVIAPKRSDQSLSPRWSNTFFALAAL